ncbi:hypothetical protein KPL78_09105 [Roseomonas sp. HJA6]|uniref:Uncharacterized protein n=1 Tax=Roseomonas alba TaxID=2846776 RepID=A0ABS7A6S2_9PROT|nr:hypothetical protein [Neoroseomonas alba]MBW6398002.1 hypothetical protein [Neoroseomonas alba]
MMSAAALGLFALAYSGVVLFALAHALRRILPPVRAAWTAFFLSAAVHGATPFLMADEERWLPLTLFWLLPHLLILPLLLLAARRQSAAA